MAGIFRKSIPGFESMDSASLIEAAAGLGLDGLMLSTLLDVDQTLDAARLSDFGAHARRCGVTLASGVGWINPLKPDRAQDVLALGEGDLRRGVLRLIEANAFLGLPNAWFTIGMIEDRFVPDIPWDRQLAAVAAFIRDLGPALRANHVRLLVKTHEEITTFEIARLIEVVGEDVLGVALDPVNFVVRLEDPVAATRRVASGVAQVHIDDAQVRFEGTGLRRYLCRAGTGDIDLPAILALVPQATRWAELHRGQFGMQAFDPAFLAQHPDLTVTEFAHVVGMAARVPGGTPIPDQDNAFARLPQLLSFLKTA